MGVMLPITINLNVYIIAKALGIFMSSLNRTSNTKILRQIQDINPCIPTNTQSVISRAIVNNYIVIASFLHRRNRI